MIIGKLIPAGSGFERDLRPEEPDLLEGETLAALRSSQPAEAATDDEYQELMESGHVPNVAVMERAGDEDGELAPEDIAQLNDDDVEDETVDE